MYLSGHTIIGFAKGSLPLSLEELNKGNRYERGFGGSLVQGGRQYPFLSGYLPVKTGVRFSKKAATASLWSSVAAQSISLSASRARLFWSELSIALLIFSFIYPRAIGGPDAICEASSVTASGKTASSTTWLKMRSARASPD